MADQIETCPSEQWERFKEKVKMSAIERSSTLKFYARAEEGKLQHDLRTLFEVEYESPGWGAKDIANVKSRLAIFQKEGYKGAMVRSRTQRFFSLWRATHQAAPDSGRKVRLVQRNSRNTYECYNHYRKSEHLGCFCGTLSTTF